MEHQLEVLLNDLVTATAVNAIEEIADILAGLRYTLDYRIADGRLPHLDRTCCERLVKALLTLTDDTVRHRWSGQIPAPQAETALLLFGGFAKEGACLARRTSWERAARFVTHARSYLGRGVPPIPTAVEEVRDVIASTPLSTLRAGLKLHTRFRRGATEEQRNNAVSVLLLLESFYPGITDWHDFVEDDEDDVQEYLLARRAQLDAEGKPPIVFPTMPPLPPPAMFADRRTDAVLSMFGTNIVTGLPSAVVRERQEQFGPNQIPPPPKPSPWRMIWEQLTDFIVIILIIAAILSAALREFDVREGWRRRGGGAKEDRIALMRALKCRAAMGGPLHRRRLCS